MECVLFGFYSAYQMVQYFLKENCDKLKRYDVNPGETIKHNKVVIAKKVNSRDKMG